MNTRNIILSGALVVLVALLTTSTSVFAGWTDDGFIPTDEHPQVYLIKKVLDICDPARGGKISGSDALPGGSMPPSGEQFGCVKIVGDRLGQYLFTGEQVGVLVAVRHTNGVDAIGYPVVMEVDGGVKSVLCNDITSQAADLKIHKYLGSGAFAEWYGHDVSADLQAQPPGKSAGTDDGFDPEFDKLYQCIYTAAPDDSGLTDVEVVVPDVDGMDEGRGALDFIWFNPEILVDVSTSDGDPISFEPGSSGQTVYSTNHLIVTNEAEGGVLLYAWLAGTDLVSSTSPAKCPDSEILDVDTYMEYRCKIGSLFSNEWNYVDNPDDTRDCDFAKDCQGADPLLTDFKELSLLTVGSWAECWFRLFIPTPCIGTFDQGQILIYARAV